MSGTIRVWRGRNGASSRLHALTTETTAAEVCSAIDARRLLLHIGRLHIRPLSPTTHPLQIQNDILSALGFSSSSLQCGDREHMRHVFAFFIEDPSQLADSSDCLRGEGSVRTGRLLSGWQTAHFTLAHHTLHVDNVSAGTSHVIRLGAVEVGAGRSSRGHRFLRLSSQKNSWHLRFDDQATLEEWTQRCRQAQLLSVSDSCDLSDRGLLLLPDRLFAAQGGVPVRLNLRRNSLLMRCDKVRRPLVGWLDDIVRLPHLTQLDLADNRLGCFPIAVTQLHALNRLNLSGNNIPILPSAIGELSNLCHVDLSANWLSSLPNEIADCTQIVYFNIAYNRFQEVPTPLSDLPLLSHWQLAGNHISSLHHLHPAAIDHVQKLDLRRNELGAGFRLPATERLTHIDIRDNPHLSTVQLTNCTGLQVLYCDRLQLTQLHLNGGQLMALHSSRNLLELCSIVVMPVPSRLVLLDLSFNRLSSLPEWISRLPCIETLDVSNNARLETLPPNILSTPALRFLRASSCALTSLPQEMTGCQLETLHIQGNRIDTLPSALFAAAPRLRCVNVSSNRLVLLPPLPPFSRIQQLLAADNLLDESSLPRLIGARRLSHLDLSANRIRFFDDSQLCSFEQLEELNLSDNRLESLSPSLLSLPALQILRAHSNQLTAVPDLSVSKSLRLVDVSHNRLSNVSTPGYHSSSLRQLDLSCNPSLTLRRTHHDNVSVVDVGEGTVLGDCTVGWSETAGQRNKLCIRQSRSHSPSSSIFSIVDGGGNARLAKSASDHLHSLALDHAPFDHAPSDGELAEWLLETHCHLGEEGERMGASGLVASLSSAPSPVLSIASTGTVRAGVIRQGRMEMVTRAYEVSGCEWRRLRDAGATVDCAGLINGVCPSAKQLGFTSMFPAILPAPEKWTIRLSSLDEAVLLACAGVWSALCPSQLALIALSSHNPHVAAKRIQDRAQSYGAEENLSVVLLRLPRAERLFTEHDLAPLLPSLPPLPSPTYASISRVSSPVSDFQFPPPPTPPLHSQPTHPSRQPCERPSHYSTQSSQYASIHKEEAEEDREESRLCKIEQRLENISVALSRFGDVSEEGSEKGAPPDPPSTSPPPLPPITDSSRRFEAARARVQLMLQSNK